MSGHPRAGRLPGIMEETMMSKQDDDQLELQLNDPRLTHPYTGCPRCGLMWPVADGLPERCPGCGLPFERAAQQD